MCTTLILLHLMILSLTTKGRWLKRGGGRKVEKIEANAPQQLLLFLVLKWLWAVSESFLYFSVAMCLISAFMGSQCALTRKSAKVINVEVIKTRNI